MIVNLDKNSEILLETKIDQNFSIEILNSFEDCYCLHEELKFD